MAGTISQRISLEGAEDIRKKLEALGQAGEQAFNQIRDAASQPISDAAQIDQTKAAVDQLAAACSSLSETLGTLSGAGETAADGVGKLGEASQQAGEQVGQATEAVSKFTLENTKSGSEIVKNTAHAALYGAEIYSLIARHESLTVALVKMALGGSATSLAFEALVGVLGGAVVAIGGVTLGIGAAVIALGVLARAAEAAAAPYEKLNSTLQKLSQNSGVSFDSLQRGEALFTQVGVSAESFRGVISKVAEEIKNLDVGAELQKSADGAKKATNDIIQAENNVREAVLRQQAAGGGAFAKKQLEEFEKLKQQQQLIDNITTAEENLSAAREKAASAAANSLSVVLEKIDQIAEGSKGITFDPLVKAETILKALALKMKEVADNGQLSSRVLLDFIANASRLNAVAAGAKFGLSEDDVDRIRRAHGELGTFDEIWKRIQSAGVLIPPETAAALERMRTEIENVERAQTRFQQAWDSSIFARFGAEVSSTLNSLKADFINFAASALEAVNKFFNALPPAVDQTMAQVKQIWFSGWAAMAETVASFAQSIGLDALAQRLQTFALTWQQSAAAAAQASEQAAQRIRLAWDQNANSAEQAAQRIKRASDQSAQATTGLDNALAGLGNTQTQTANATQNTSTATAGLTQNQQAMLAQVEAAARAYERQAQAAQAATDALNKHTAAVRQARVAAAERAGLRDPMTGQLDIAAYDLAGFASGGLMGGRGTGTSDSNLAWVSRGEHIMPARAVAQPGVLALLEALRRSGGNLSRLLDGMGRFALGGIVPRAMPAFASGGLAGGMSNVTIAFPGLPPISGLRASAEVVDQLHKAAALAQVRSGGRKPSRYS